MNSSQTDEQATQDISKILYVEDDLAKNIPRLLRLFEKYLSKAEQERLQQLETDLDGYGAEPEEIQQIFRDVQLIDIEYRFPDALAKILEDVGRYALFVIDRNLAEADYTFEEVHQIDPQYSQEFHKRFSEREGDYILLKLAMAKKVDVLEKFYFLTAYTAQADEIRSSQEIKDLIDFGVFQEKNFIEKGNEEDRKRLSDVIENSPVNKPELHEQIQSSLAADMHVFYFQDSATTLRGTFVSPALRIRTRNGKKTINTSQIQRISRIGQYENAEFKIELKTKDVLQGRILDKKLKIKTQIDENFQIVSQNIRSVELE